MTREHPKRVVFTDVLGDRFELSVVSGGDSRLFIQGLTATQDYALDLDTARRLRDELVRMVQFMEEPHA